MFPGCIAEGGSLMDAKVFLNQLNKLDRMIENKLIEKEQWKAIALGVGSGGADVLIKGKLHKMDKVQSTPNPQKMEDAVIRYVDIEAEIDACVDELIEAKKDVISVIEKLSAEEYDLLHKVYVQHKELADVADAFKKTYSWVTTIHGRALKNVQRILDERDGVSDA
jgi:hypothetical protein